VEDEADALVGQVLDRRYRLDEVIGRGGVGSVFRATHTLIGKALAIKLLRAAHVRDPAVLQRFLREALLASSVKHPNVVDISDYGQLPEGGAFYVMEYLRGRTLAERIDEDGPLPVPEAIEVARQICHGLQAAHGQGIVHRGLKPENVFCCKGTADDPRIKLLDFGIARAESQRITMAGEVLGTPEYMAPEQALGHDVDARADLYAVGIILFEMLTGLVPFRSDDIGLTIQSHITAPPARVTDIAPQLAAMQSVAGLVDRLLAKDPDQRPDSAEQAAEDLADALAQDLRSQGVDRSAGAPWVSRRSDRSTVAIGSGGMGGAARADPRLMQEVSPSPPTMGWAGSAGTGPRGPVYAARPIAPERRIPTPRRSSLWVSMIMAGAATVAGLGTFGVYASVVGFRTTTPDVVEPALELRVPRPRLPEFSIVPAEGLLPGRSGLGPRTPSPLPTDVHAEPPAPAAPSVEAVIKPRRRSPSRPQSQPAAAQPPAPQASPENDDVDDAAGESGSSNPLPENQPKPRAPGDLKDPFFGN
jgi:serine/threonine-protein kinase